jgi:signal transduction histidine kinase/ligand-binding sensor domain-containing protein
LAKPYPHLAIHHWETTEGMPQDTVNAISQTPDGYLWIGTYSGLARFDGQRFTVFSHRSQPSLAAERVVALHVDQRGDLWIAAETGEIIRYHEGIFSPVNLPAAPQRSKTMAIDSDELGNVWILDREGLLTRIEDGYMVSAPYRERQSRGPTTMARDPASGRLYVLHLGVVTYLDKNQLREIPLNASTETRAIMIGPAQKRGLWVIMEDELRLWNGDRWLDERITMPKQTGGVTAIMEMPEGTLAIATSNYGMFLIERTGRISQFDAKSQLRDNWVRCLYLDHESTLWAGTSVAGLCILQSARFDRIILPSDWPPTLLKTVSPRRAGGVWVGTEGAGLLYYDDSGWTRCATQGLANMYIWSVLEREDGQVWISTWGGGVFLFDGTRFKRVPGLDDPTASVGCSLATIDGSSWFGTTHGLWRHKPDGQVERYGSEHGLAHANVGTLAEAPDGSVWFGQSDGGVGCWRDGKIRILGKVFGTPTVQITAIDVDAAGVVWVGTLNGGLFRLENDRVSARGERLGLSLGSIGYIQNDGDQLWLYTNNAMLRVPRARLEALEAGQTAPPGRVEVFSFGRGSMQIAACRTADRQFWVPSAKGLLRLDPSVPRKAKVPRPLVEAVLIDGIPHYLSASSMREETPLQIPPGSGRIEIKFTAPAFHPDEQLQFHYRLGREPWTEAGETRTANYHRLAPGDYRFEVMVESDTESASTSVSFTVQPYFWQRGWVRATGYLVGVGMIGVLVWLQAQRSNRARNEELRRQHALDRERTRIARDIHDDLGSSLTRISLLTQNAQKDLARPADAGHSLDQILRTARQLTRQMDEIVWAVSPRHDSLESVVHYLTSFAQEHLGIAGIQCRFDLPPVIPPQPVYAEARHHLFLAFQEAIHNVVKHARATRVLITVSLGKHDFSVQIEDNGIGLPPQTKPRLSDRNGLRNLTLRMSDIGGTCEFSTPSTGGTRVTLTLPLTAPAV